MDENITFMFKSYLNLLHRRRVLKNKLYKKRQQHFQNALWHLKRMNMLVLYLENQSISRTIWCLVSKYFIKDLLKYNTFSFRKEIIITGKTVF